MSTLSCYFLLNNFLPLIKFIIETFTNFCDNCSLKRQTDIMPLQL